MESKMLQFRRTLPFARSLDFRFGSFASLSPRATHCLTQQADIIADFWHVCVSFGEDSSLARAVRGQSEPTVLSVTSTPRMTIVAAAHVLWRVPSDAHHSATMHASVDHEQGRMGPRSGK